MTWAKFFHKRERLFSWWLVAKEWVISEGRKGGGKVSQGSLKVSGGLLH